MGNSTEMKEKKTAKEVELEKKREKLRRVREYGEQIRRNAPGTENQLLAGPDAGFTRGTDGDTHGQGRNQDYESPSKARLRYLNERERNLRYSANKQGNRLSARESR